MTTSKKEKKQDDLLYWCIALLIALIILFIFGSRFFSKDVEFETVTYNNWEFTKMADTWWFEWQKDGTLFTVPLRFNPYETEEIPITGTLNNALFNSKNEVYITFDLSNASNQDFSILALATTELTQNMATAIERIPIAACTNDKSEACDERPIIQCENANEPVIYLNEGGEASIVLNGACIEVKGEGFELVRAVDRLLYHWYGIIE